MTSDASGYNISHKDSVEPIERNELQQIDELEIFLVSAWHSLSRWHTRLLNTAGIVNGNSLDFLILKTISGSPREINPVDICLALHIEDQHTVTYSLKKLRKHDLVWRNKRGKMVFYSITESGHKLCTQFSEFRKHLLSPLFESLKNKNLYIEKSRTRLEALAQMYNQASQQVILS